MIETQVGATNVAALLIEPIQGEGGFIVPADGFLPALSEWTTKNGVVFIADEIQSGFCRTGDWFAVDHEGVVPDLVATAKGLAGGMPLAAVTGRTELMNQVHEGGLGGTYGGNPVAAVAALATIKTLRDRNLASRARETRSDHFEKLAHAPTRRRDHWRGAWTWGDDRLRTRTARNQERQRGGGQIDCDLLQPERCGCPRLWHVRQRDSPLATARHHRRTTRGRT